MLRLNEIWYCLIVSKSSLKILAYHSFPKNQTRKIQKFSNKKCDNYPQSTLLIACCFSSQEQPDNQVLLFSKKFSSAHFTRNKLWSKQSGTLHIAPSFSIFHKLGFFFYLIINSKPKPRHFRSRLKKFVFSHQIYRQISSKSMTFNSVIFSFSVILGDADLEQFFKKSKTSRSVFFWDARLHITWKKKMKAARSIWGGMPHIYIFFLWRWGFFSRP